MTTSDWRFVTGHASYADFSISVSPALEKAVAEGIAPPTVYVNLFSEDSITIGVTEDPEQVLDLAYCQDQAITVRKRVNSGGAIYAGKGSAFLVLVLPTALPGVPTSAAEAFPLILGHAAESLKRCFGVPAAYRPLNDVEIDGRKLMPTSIKMENGVMTCRLVCNLTSMDTEKAAKAMPMAPEKVKDKKHKDLGSRYTWLAREVGREISEQELTDWARDVVKTAFGDVVLNNGTLSAQEQAYANQFRQDLTSQDWLFEKSEKTRYGSLTQPGDQIVRGREKAPAGLLWFSALVRQDKIVKAILNGDFHPRPVQSVQWLEDALAGIEATPAACEAVYRQFLARPDVELAGVDVAHLMAATAKALDAIKADSPA
jgi:lipoate-protein ligase A